MAAVDVKFDVVEPAATITEAGTVSDELLSETATAEPPEGAAPESVIVQIDVAPEVRLVGEHCNVDTVTASAVTVRDAVLEPPLTDAVTVTL
jgi:hypothetical protein